MRVALEEPPKYGMLRLEDVGRGQVFRLASDQYDHVYMMLNASSLRFVLLFNGRQYSAIDRSMKPESHVIVYDDPVVTLGQGRATKDTLRSHDGH